MKAIRSKLFIGFIIVICLASSTLVYDMIVHPTNNWAKQLVQGKVEGKAEGGKPFGHGPRGEFGDHKPPRGERPDGFQVDSQSSGLWGSIWNKGFMKDLGKYSIIIAGLSFGWFALKARIKSKKPLLKKTAHTLFRSHVWIGWVVITLGIIHSLYFFLEDITLKKTLTITGLAATIIMIGLLLYGYFIRRIRNKFLRTFHKWLSFAWLPVLFLHGGDVVVQMVAAVAATAGVVWIVERYLNKSRAIEGSI